MTTPTATTARARFAAFTAAMERRSLERRDIIVGMTAALVAGEHVFLLGRPGTGKSDLVDAFSAALDAAKFVTLCNRYQQPDEIFGGWDLGEYQRSGVLRRVTANRLPEAQFAFLDEVFKGSSATLNTLLRMINERSFERDGAMTPVPLRMVVGASNETPDPRDGLDAFYDRFLLRYDVRRLMNPDNIDAVIWGSLDVEVPTLSWADVEVMAEVAKTIDGTDEVKRSVRAIRDALEAEGIQVSDRRWRKIRRLLQAQAAISGREVITSADLAIVAACTWSTLAEKDKARTIVEKHTASWVRDLAKAEAALDEAYTRAKLANEKIGSKKRDTLDTLGALLDLTTDTVQSIKALAERTPEAKPEAKRLMARVADVKALISGGMAACGMGVEQ